MYGLKSGERPRPETETHVLSVSQVVVKAGCDSCRLGCLCKCGFLAWAGCLPGDQHLLGCGMLQRGKAFPEVEQVASLPALLYPWFPSESHTGSDTSTVPARLLSAVT